ncbi:MAG: DsbA family protein [Chloroflexi bacterium]|nr:DsbA family protein [Chloroflexota bacterium]
MATKSKKSTPVVEVEEMYTPDAEDTITLKRSHFYSALVVLAFGVGLMLGYVLWGRSSVVTVAAPTEEQQPIRYDIPTEGFPSFGPDDAPITIVEFSDFQCPFCRRFHEQTYQALLDAYPGQIRFVYRNLPLTSIHPDAMPAAVASLCANDQNVYWDFHEKLFSSDAFGRDVYVQYATDLGIDVEEFTACLDSGKHDDFIDQDMQYAFSIGVQSTPTFFINGLALVGAQPLPNFQQLIDQELAGEIP